MAIQLKLKKGETVERGLKRLKKILDKEGLIKTLRETRYFEKPCVKARTEMKCGRRESDGRFFMSGGTLLGRADLLSYAPWTNLTYRGRRRSSATWTVRSSWGLTQSSRPWIS